MISSHSRVEAVSGATLKPWVVVLAGGKGMRLSHLTSLIYGRPLPKQFAVLDGTCSLLQNTLQRALWLTSPDRVLVVVSARYRRLASEQVGAFRGVRLVTQPFSGGTALGMLLPLLMIAKQHDDDDVVFLPSDHHFEHPVRFTQALETVLADRQRGDSVVLLGVEATHPATDFGSILPTTDIRSRDDLSSVTTFAEKPAGKLAKKLMLQGGLVSTFVTVGTVRSFVHAFKAHLPNVTRALSGVVFHNRWNAVVAAFLVFGGLSFSRDVLERLQDLKVFALPDCGWSDLGTPERVFAVFQDAAAKFSMFIPAPRE